MPSGGGKFASLLRMSGRLGLNVKTALIAMTSKLLRAKAQNQKRTVTAIRHLADTIARNSCEKI
jgi:hypothetical protein